MTDGLNQVGFVIEGSSAVVGGEASWGDAPLAALIYAHLIVASTHWWISHADIHTTVLPHQTTCGRDPQ